MMAHRISAFLGKKIVRFGENRSGAGAIEFAILFPVLVMVYIGSFEITIGLSVSKRAARASAAVADIITQQQTVTPTWLADMPSVAKAILVPYSTTGLTMKISGIQADSAGISTIAWSWAQDGKRPYVAKTVVDLPKDLKQPNSFYIRAEFAIPYSMFKFSPGFMPDSLRTITIKRTYYYRQRQGDSIACDLC